METLRPQVEPQTEQSFRILEPPPMSSMEADWINEIVHMLKYMEDSDVKLNPSQQAYLDQYRGLLGQ